MAPRYGSDPGYDVDRFHNYKPGKQHKAVFSVGQSVCVCVCVCVGPLTLDDGQEDYNDKEEEGDVKDDAIDLILVTRRVLNLVSDPSTCSHPHIHVEHVALKHRERETERTFNMLDLE